MWPFKSVMVGQPVQINCSDQDAEFRKLRAETRVVNLTAKLKRLRLRVQTEMISQEIVNTIVAIRAWNDVQELAEFELNQRKGVSS